MKVSIVMGSKSDYPTMKKTEELLNDLKVDCEVKVISAHRTPELMFEYAKNAEANGIQIIIAGAGGAAHLPGMIASLTTIPVIGVPIKSKTLQGIDSLLSIVQMPAGIPVATVAIGEAGAKNAAILAAAILANNDEIIKNNLKKYRYQLTTDVLENSKL